MLCCKAGCPELKKIAFIISSNTAGGAERVIVALANQAVKMGNEPEVIILTKKPHFNKIDEKIPVFEPEIKLGSNLGRLVSIFRLFHWLRSRLKESQAQHILCFGGKYNSFVLMSSLWLNKNVFVSDRSRPGISYGRFIDLLNKMMYRKAHGVIAQTEKAKEVVSNNTKHKNIRVIPNPFNQIDNNDLGIGNEERMILSVGRFIASKHQDWLVDYFIQINNTAWKLCFLGDGQHQEAVKEKSRTSTLADHIKFEGNRTDVDNWYQKASVFAFTSTSEGFPNALGEAMAHGCACISFDCVAGPSELIDDGVNGFLIPEGDHALYVQRLQQLMEDEELRIRFGKNAMEKMKQFSIDKIAKQYLDFILES